MIVSLITTYNRPSALERSLPQIARLGIPMLVMDDGSPNPQCEHNFEICQQSGALYWRLPNNRGLAAAMNIGLSYWLADSQVEWISYFQDDVDVHPKCLDIIMQIAPREPNIGVFTGHDAVEHPHHRTMRYGKLTAKYKKTCAGLHIHADVKYWKGIMPVPTYQLGAPKRNGNNGARGIGSNVDWWIVKDSPNSAKKQNKEILCLPGLVRTFYWLGQDSSWNNHRKCGEEPPLITWTN